MVIWITAGCGYDFDIRKKAPTLPSSAAGSLFLSIISRWRARILEQPLPAVPDNPPFRNLRGSCDISTASAPDEAISAVIPAFFSTSLACSQATGSSSTMSTVISSGRTSPSLPSGATFAESRSGQRDFAALRRKLDRIPENVIAGSESVFHKNIHLSDFLTRNVEMP